MRNSLLVATTLAASLAATVALPSIASAQVPLFAPSMDYDYAVQAPRPLYTGRSTGYGYYGSNSSSVPYSLERHPSGYEATPIYPIPFPF